MSYSRWLFSDWYTFWHVDFDDPRLAIWSCHSDEQPVFTVAKVREFLVVPEAMIEIPGFNESNEEERAVLVDCMTRFVAEVGWG